MSRPSNEVKKDIYSFLKDQVNEYGAEILDILPLVDEYATAALAEHNAIEEQNVQRLYHTVFQQAMDAVRTIRVGATDEQTDSGSSNDNVGPGMDEKVTA